MSEFPEGQAPGRDAGDTPGGGDGQVAAGDPAGTQGSGSEPGWGDSGTAAGGEDLPDLLDEQSMEDVLAAMEAAMGEGQESGSPGQNGAGGGTSAGDGQQDGSGSGASAGNGQQPGGGMQAGGDDTRRGGQPPYGTGSGTGGPLTPAEQVAILDAQLERGTGEFDSMILEEQANQRSAARSRTASTPPADPASGAGGSSASGGGMADAGEYGAGGGYSTGGGMGGAAKGGGTIPQNTAKYPPPADIPNGNDDDVVARQLREAAMREPDPAVRERLWDEYRKYKGIAQ